MKTCVLCCTGFIISNPLNEEVLTSLLFLFIQQLLGCLLGVEFYQSWSLSGHLPKCWIGPEQRLQIQMDSVLCEVECSLIPGVVSDICDGCLQVFKYNFEWYLWCYQEVRQTTIYLRKGCSDWRVHWTLHVRLRRIRGGTWGCMGGEICCCGTCVTCCWTIGTEGAGNGEGAECEQVLHLIYEFLPMLQLRPDFLEALPDSICLRRFGSKTFLWIHKLSYFVHLSPRTHFLLELGLMVLIPAAIMHFRNGWRYGWTARLKSSKVWGFERSFILQLLNTFTVMPVVKNIIDEVQNMNSLFHTWRFGDFLKKSAYAMNGLWEIFVWS